MKTRMAGQEVGRLTFYGVLLLATDLLTACVFNSPDMEVILHWRHHPGRTDQVFVSEDESVVSIGTVDDGGGHLIVCDGMLREAGSFDLRWPAGLSQSADGERVAWIGSRGIEVHSVRDSRLIARGPPSLGAGQVGKILEGCDKETWILSFPPVVDEPDVEIRGGSSLTTVTTGRTGLGRKEWRYGAVDRLTSSLLVVGETTMSVIDGRTLALKRTVELPMPKPRAIKAGGGRAFLAYTCGLVLGYSIVSGEFDFRRVLGASWITRVGLSGNGETFAIVARSEEEGNDAALLEVYDATRGQIERVAALSGRFPGVLQDAAVLEKRGLVLIAAGDLVAWGYSPRLGTP